jgi:hypothetical protein
MCKRAAAAQARSTSDTRSATPPALASGIGRDSKIFYRHSVRADEVYL